MKPIYTQVIKYEYNGKLYDTKEEIRQAYEDDTINSLYERISKVAYDDNIPDIAEEILKIIAKIPNTTLAILRTRMNQIEKEEQK